MPNGKTQRSEHLFVTEMESAQVFNYKVDEQSLLLDLKVLLKEYYSATFAVAKNSLKLQFTNGQIFELSVKEVV
ncbi:MAG: hypothetical protein NC132_02245 [Corallococcus sp.]|nr:hypothetical protein [Corallococcus sp.]MCM1358930.1 hypothetical protein [Corallococcus sp.]MCM1394918.1 hypothetical protein [Corallococcus sp.]